METQKEVKAGEFICDTPEHLYWAEQHIKRYFEIAEENKQVLKVIVIYIPKPQ